MLLVADGDGIFFVVTFAVWDMCCPQRSSGLNPGHECVCWVEGVTQLLQVWKYTWLMHQAERGAVRCCVHWFLLGLW